MTDFVRSYWNECVAFHAALCEIMPQWLLLVLGIICLVLCFVLVRMEYVTDDEYDGARTFLPSGNPFLFFGSSMFFIAQWIADYVTWGKLVFLVKGLAWFGILIQGMFIFGLGCYVLIQLLNIFSNIRHLSNIFLGISVLFLNLFGQFLCMNLIGPISVICFFALGFMMLPSGGRSGSKRRSRNSSGGYITDQNGGIHYVSKHMGNDSVLTKDGETYHRMPDGNYRKF